MRRPRMLVVALLSSLALLAPATPALADNPDNGDNRVACNNYELCFQFVWNSFTTSTFQRHFWYNDNDHTDDLWHNVGDNITTLSIKRTAGGFWNRDSTCAVTIYDYVNNRPYAYLTVARNVKTGAIADRNTSHRRCA